MLPIGLPAHVARRRHAELNALSKLDNDGQNEVLGVLWYTATHADVPKRYLVDLRHITVALKRTQWIEEAAGFSKPH
jgi:hypothetical protein